MTESRSRHTVGQTGRQKAARRSTEWFQFLIKVHPQPQQTGKSVVLKAPLVRPVGVENALAGRGERMWGRILRNSGGDTWKTWYRTVQNEIVNHQVSRGSCKKGRDVHGSWNPTKPVGANEEYAVKAGRFYLTTMCMFVLETPFRHAPIYSVFSKSE